LAALQALLAHFSLVTLGETPELRQLLENSNRLVFGFETNKKLTEFVT
jgi:hypothetical protein